MGAVPKTKTARSRRDSRRAQNFKLALPGIIECPKCHEMKQSHRACRACGFYKGREVIKIEDE